MFAFFARFEEPKVMPSRVTLAILSQQTCCCAIAVPSRSFLMLSLISFSDSTALTILKGPNLELGGKMDQC